MVKENHFCITGLCLKNDDVIGILNQFPSKVYNEDHKNWEFNFSDYKELRRKLQLVPNLAIIPIPEKILDLILKPLETGACTCLKAINPKILEALQPFQKESICIGIGQMGKIMLADETGLDKKLPALAIADYFRDSWPLLICTTRLSKETWVHYINEFYGYNDIDLANVNESNEDISEAKVIICSHRMMTNIIEPLMERKIGCIIIDESQHLKNPKAQITQSALQISNNAKRIILISGSPAYAMPCELFSQLRIIDDFFKDYEEFEMRYCEGEKTEFGWYNRGHSNLPELKLLLRHFMVRKTKSEIMPYSNITRKAVLLHINDKDKESEDFKEAHRSYLNADNIMTKFYVTADLKKGTVCRYLKKHKDQFNKTVIFAYHAIMLDAIEECLLENDVELVRIDGSTSDLDCKERIVEFKSSDTCKVILMSLKSAESGIDLTEATSIIFAELDWSPITLLQAESRVHRFGNTHQINIKYLLANKTVDKYVWKMLKKKEMVLTDVGIYDQHLAEEANFIDSESSSESSLSDEESDDDKATRKHIKPKTKTEVNIKSPTSYIEDSESQSLFNKISTLNRRRQRNTSHVIDDSDESSQDVKRVLKTKIKETGCSDINDEHLITLEKGYDDENDEESSTTENVTSAIKQEAPIEIIDINEDTEEAI